MSFGCFCSFVLLCFFVLWTVLFCETGSHYVTQADPELMTSILSLLHAGIIVLYHHASLFRNCASLVNIILIPNESFSGNQKKENVLQRTLFVCVCSHLNTINVFQSSSSGITCNLQKFPFLRIVRNSSKSKNVVALSGLESVL